MDSNFRFEKFPIYSFVEKMLIEKKLIILSPIYNIYVSKVMLSIKLECKQGPFLYKRTIIIFLSGILTFEITQGEKTMLLSSEGKAFSQWCEKPVTYTAKCD